jgi:hypothetical protein
MQRHTSEAFVLGSQSAVGHRTMQTSKLWFRNFYVLFCSKMVLVVTFGVKIVGE